MNNAPEVEIEYLINYELEFTNKSESSKLSSEANLNELEAKIEGKKGLHLNGGSVSETGEVSGTLLDGTYTFYKNSEGSYNGWMSESFSTSEKLKETDAGYPFINADKYESKTGEELEEILKTENDYMFAGKKRTFYCTTDSENFKAGNVYELVNVIYRKKDYLQVFVEPDSSGTYFVKTDMVDAFGEPVYEEMELPREYDANLAYYYYHTVDLTYYTANLKEQAQFVDISTKNDDTYIKSILIYFDPVAAEYATKLSFSNAINDDGSVNNNFNPNTKIRNNKMVFMYNFGETSTLKSVRVNFEEWSKANAPLKILKIVTGYTGRYDKTTLLNLQYGNNKFSTPEELSFGVSSQEATIKFIDKEGMVYDLYAKNLIWQNIQARIYIDNIWQGNFYLDSKSSERGDNSWVFDCVDKLETIKNDVVETMQIRDNLPLKDVISHTLKYSGLEIEYSDEALQVCSETIIPKAYILSQQKIYDILLKCCQVGLLRMYVYRDKIRIVRGV